MAQRLISKTESELIVELRVPETHSASEADHRWHRRIATVPVNVTEMTAVEVMDEAERMMGEISARDDHLYRVVLVNTKTTGWVLL